jgi:hypothetical protein
MPESLLNFVQGDLACSSPFPGRQGQTDTVLPHVHTGNPRSLFLSVPKSDRLIYRGTLCVHFLLVATILSLPLQSLLTSSSSPSTHRSVLGPPSILTKVNGKRILRRGRKRATYSLQK